MSIPNCTVGHRREERIEVAEPNEHRQATLSLLRSLGDQKSLPEYEFECGDDGEGSSTLRSKLRAFAREGSSTKVVH